MQHFLNLPPEQQNPKIIFSPKKAEISLSPFEFPTKSKRAVLSSPDKNQCELVEIKPSKIVFECELNYLELRSELLGELRKSYLLKKEKELRLGSDATTAPF